MNPTPLFGYKVLGHLQGLSDKDQAAARNHLETRLKAKGIPVVMAPLGNATDTFGLLTHDDVSEMMAKASKYNPLDGREPLAVKLGVGPESLNVNFNFGTDEQGRLELWNVCSAAATPAEGDKTQVAKLKTLFGL